MLLRNIWIAALAIQAIAAFLFLLRDLVKITPILWCSFVFGIVKGIALITADTSASYAQISSASAPMTLLFAGSAVVEVFLVITSQYPNFGKFGKVILSAIAIMAACASAATRWFPAQPWLLRPELILERYATAALIVATLASWLAVKMIGFPTTKAGTRIVWIMFFQAASGLPVTIMMAAGHAPFSVRVGWPIISGFLAAVMWCFIPRWVEAKMPEHPTREQIAVARATGPAWNEALREAVAAVRHVTE